MTIVALVGVDKVGKTQTKELLNKKTNFKYCVLDRFIPDNYAYDKFYMRRNFTNWLYEETYLPKSIFKIVYLYASKSELKKRFKKHNETDIVLDSSYDILTSHYENYLKETQLDFIKLNTTYDTPEQTVSKIIKWLKKF